MNSQFWWWVARSSGIVAWLALTASVLWGILLPAKVSDKQRPAWILDLHRWLGTLTAGFTVLHIAALWLDSYVTFSLLDFLVPYSADWKPGAVALGVVAMWAIVVVQLSSTFKKHISRKVWRSLHLLSYLAFFGGTLHGTLAGTDAASMLYQLTTIALVGAVATATVFRVMTRRSLRQAAAKAAAGVRAPAPAAPAEDLQNRPRIPEELRRR